MTVEVDLLHCLNQRLDVQRKPWRLSGGVWKPEAEKSETEAEKPELVVERTKCRCRSRRVDDLKLRLVAGKLLRRLESLWDSLA